METNLKVHVSADLKWWLKPYLYVLVFFCAVMGTEPDEQKLQQVILKGIKLKVTNLG